MKRAVAFFLGCLALIALALLVIWAANGFAPLGLETNGLIALILGIVGTSVLAVGLMTLVFYSERRREQGEDRTDRGPPPPGV
ncbi:MAG TPA: hypothetical protein VFA50_23355 [Stellaceae bacterium]|nr:hypothetical protein [Stellaceae bacterium]